MKFSHCSFSTCCPAGNQQCAFVVIRLWSFGSETGSQVAQTGLEFIRKKTLNLILLLPLWRTGIIGVCHLSDLLCLGLNPGLKACEASILPSAITPRALPDRLVQALESQSNFTHSVTLCYAGSPLHIAPCPHLSDKFSQNFAMDLIKVSFSTK